MGHSARLVSRTAASFQRGRLSGDRRKNHQQVGSGDLLVSLLRTQTDGTCPHTYPCSAPGLGLGPVAAWLLEGGGDICQRIYRNKDLVWEGGTEGLAAARSSSARALRDEHSDRRVLYLYGGSNPALRNTADLSGLFCRQATEQESEDPLEKGKFLKKKSRADWLVQELQLAGGMRCRPLRASL